MADPRRGAMSEVRDQTRRRFLNIAAAGGAGGVMSAVSWPARVYGEGRLPSEGEGDKREEDVSPAEDLMREHGVLNRILLVYSESLRRLDAKQELPPKPVADSAKIIRNFIEEYHEKLEEDFLFPRFTKANKLTDLVAVLLQQHKAGRRLTDITLRLATPQALKTADGRGQLADSLRQFIRMYRPHEAREDTVLFPAFRGIVSAHEYDSLGDDFEKKEHELFGEDGFEKMVDKVASIEMALGIYELSQFTPKF
jgi:hemerythrin-like domain-containing protein